MASAVASMTTLNGGGDRGATFAGLDVHACTDMTGFGLLGHALEMAEQSGVSLVLQVGTWAGYRERSSTPQPDTFPEAPLVTVTILPAMCASQTTSTEAGTAATL